MILRRCNVTMAVSWVSVLVKIGAKVLKPATILTVTHEDSFGSLLERISSGFQDESVEKTLISSSTNKDTHTVPLNAPVVQVGLFQVLDK